MSATFSPKPLAAPAPAVVFSASATGLETVFGA
jgi:hypothetical protein